MQNLPFTTALLGQGFWLVAVYVFKTQDGVGSTVQVLPYLAC